MPEKEAEDRSGVVGGDPPYWEGPAAAPGGKVDIDAPTPPYEKPAAEDSEAVQE